MLFKTLLFFILSFTVISCGNKKQVAEAEKIKKILSIDTSNNILATWVSHNSTSFQILELKDSTNAIVYWYIYNPSQATNKEFFYKGIGKVADWNKNKLSIHTDKYNLYYTIQNDSLFLRDEMGVIEKLGKIKN